MVFAHQCLSLLVFLISVSTSFQYRLPVSIARGTRLPHASEPRCIGARLRTRAWRIAPSSLYSSAGADKIAEGAFVDTTVTINDKCLDCDVCRWMCPKTFGRSGIRAVVKEQPQTDAEKQAVLAAAIACPMGAIETTIPIDSRVLRLFPKEINRTHIPGVMHLGYHSQESMGATPYLVRRKAGNIMIDCPRYDKNLADAIEELGGIAAMVFTHWESVVEDQKRWKERFPNLIRIMHGTDYHADAPSFEHLLRGGTEWTPEPDLKFIHTPGHTVGSICVQVNTSHDHCVPGSVGSDNNRASSTLTSALPNPETVMFTGDLITYSMGKGRLDGYKEYNKGQVWLQKRSMISLGGDRHRFQWMLPAHGRMIRFNDDRERSDIILEAAQALEEGADGMSAFKIGYY